VTRNRPDADAWSGPLRSLAFVTGYVEKCLRCGAAMDWRHQTWQCPRCRFKLGCCEGQTGEPSACAAEKISATGTDPAPSVTVPRAFSQ
jgi:hypothetical protein